LAVHIVFPLVCAFRHTPCNCNLIATTPTKTSKPHPQALRRLRLQLFYDERAWMFPVGALTHCMITIPFWIW
jgi:hypothetical protein